jgi:type II secretory pathway pseudopilin PulG
MTLVEVMLVVAIIALLAAVMVPAVQRALRGRANGQTAYQLRCAVEAFEMYAGESGSYPPDSYPGVIPPEMADYYFPYFKITEWWPLATELGGAFDWDVGYHGFAASVSISSPTASQQQLQEYDQLIDDGDLDTGRLRLVGNQLHFILEE